MAYCEDYNNRKTTSPKVQCKKECSAVKGYKCTFTPAPKEFEAMMDDAVAAESGKSAARKTVRDFKYPVAFAAFASLALGVYAYRRHQAKYTPIS